MSSRDFLQTFEYFLFQNLKNIGLVSDSLREVGVEHTSLCGSRRIKQLIDELHNGTIRVIIATDVASRYF